MTMPSAEGNRSVADIDVENLEIIRESVRVLADQAAATTGLRRGMRVLDVAPQDHEGIGPYLQDDVELVTIDIDPDSGATVIGDICQLNAELASGSFDLVFCTEVLEHVSNPFAAVREMHRLLRVGGWLYASAPYDFRIHGPLPDNWRFTEHGWRELMRDFDDVEVFAVDNPLRFLMPIHYRVKGRRG